MDDTLVTRMADIFAWQIDFSRELRTGDRWRIVVKKMMAEDKFVGWGPILAAEFVNGDTVYPAIYYKDLAGKGGYFDSEGQSLRKMFLKSPVAFSRITSRFQRQRFHPILKINRPHRGVDYGAAPGTPVQTVGDGVVLSKKHNKTSGNVMHVRHNSKYTTSYHHLKGFASGLKKGSRVTQGQVIGYVGATGLATGPHLHFEFYEDGRFVDPLGVKFPSADPVSVAEMDRFRTAAQQKLQTLPHWDEGEMFETQPSIAVR
jgi:murein DD-endopeptidase MepM/ murein hydrolase activator NlpD